MESRAIADIIYQFKSFPSPASPSKLYEVQHYFKNNKSLSQEKRTKSPAKNIAYLVSIFGAKTVKPIRPTNI
jgi:hypothetical protein